MLAPSFLELKMKVRFIDSIAGLADEDAGLPEHSFAAGQVALIPDAKAKAWIASGICSPVKGKSAQASTADGDDEAGAQAEMGTEAQQPSLLDSAPPQLQPAGEAGAQ